MSDYKHIYNAIDNAMRHIQQAQECCDDTMHLDKEACGTWKKELKAVEKQLKGCYKKVEGKHKKTPNKKPVKTASYDSQYKDEMITEEEVAQLRALEDLMYEDDENGPIMDQYDREGIDNLEQIFQDIQTLDYNIYALNVDAKKPEEYREFTSDQESINKHVETMKKLKQPNEQEIYYMQMIDGLEFRSYIVIALPLMDNDLYHFLRMFGPISSVPLLQR